LPTTWKIPGVNFNGSGIGTVGSSSLRLDSPDGSVIVIVDLKSGGIQALINNQMITLRGQGPDGEPIETAALVTVAGQSSPALFRLVESTELTVPATPSATPSPSSTPQPLPPTPTPTNAR
jgi:hypothetical protein